jgi:hypothetical protein
LIQYAAEQAWLRWIFFVNVSHLSILERGRGDD